MKKHNLKAAALLMTILSALMLCGCSHVNVKTAQWEAAGNVYHLYIKMPESQLSLDKEEALSDDFERLLSELEQEKGLFVVDSTRFNELGGKKMYAHNKESMQEMGIAFDENIDPKGKCLTVSKSYLAVNPIEAVDGTPAQTHFSQDENTLNILVPVKYQDREAEIMGLYRSFFFFQKITVANIYEKDAGRPLTSTLESDLDVNIIYVKNEQSYFTFNPNVVKETNNVIVDPMVIIYDYKVHSSYAYSYAGTGAFFAVESGEEAFETIQPATEGIKGIDQYILGVRLASKHHLPWREE